MPRRRGRRKKKKKKKKKMLGRVRPSSFSLECLELERSPPKTVKADSLSVYEATILKLRQGSQRDLASISEHVTEETNNDDSSIPTTNMLSSSITSMAIETSDTNTSCFTNSSSGLSNENNKKTSIAYMFARYNKSCQQSQTALIEDLMMVESSCSNGSICSSPDDTLVFDSCPQPKKK